MKGSQWKDTFTGSSDDDVAEGMGGADVFKMGKGQDQVEYSHETDGGATHGAIINLSTAKITVNVGFGSKSVAAGTGDRRFWQGRHSRER